MLPWLEVFMSVPTFLADAGISELVLDGERLEPWSDAGLLVRVSPELGMGRRAGRWQYHVP